MLQKKVNLFGLEIDDIPLSRALELARVSLKGGEERVFFTPNLEMLEGARKNEKTRDILNSASVLLPDGSGLLLVSELLGTPIRNRVAGIDFGEKLVALCEKERKRLFLLGGASGVAKRAAKRLIKRYPDLIICGIHHGYFNLEEEGELIKKIRRAEPDALIVCMGFPRQEKFAYEHQKDFSDIKVIACLGGAIDVWAGLKLRAPDIIQKIHLEWLWRIMGEPWRLKRFILSLPALFCALGIKTKK